MRVAFVVADVRAQVPTYTTVYLAQAARRRGHDVAFVGVDDLTLCEDNSVTALTTRPTADPPDHAELCRALAAEETRVAEEPLAAFDVVFLRYNPHRERPAAHNPTIDFGWRLRLGGVLVVNDPEGTQRAGRRMYLSGLPAEIRPRTLITREPARVKAFLKSLDAPAVVKPLAERPGGAENVFYVARGQVKNLNQMIGVVRKTGYVVVQEYLPEVAQGEKRMLLLGGEPIRVGEHTAIYKRVGTTRRRCRFEAEEQRIVALLGAKLVSDGLYFVGVDVVGGKVLEVNVFTPGGIHANHELYGIDVAEVVIRDLERRVEVRQAYRKSMERVA